MFERMRSVSVKYKKKLMAENIIYLGKSMSFSPHSHSQKYFTLKLPLLRMTEIFFMSFGEDSLNLNWRRRGTVMQHHLSPRQL